MRRWGWHGRVKDSIQDAADIEDLRVAATTRTYDSAVAVPVYRPFRVVSFPSNGAYSKTLNKLENNRSLRVEWAILKRYAGDNETLRNLHWSDDR